MKESTTTKSSLIKIGGGILGIAAVMVILIAVNVIINSFGIRADLTENKLYTLSEGTRNILSEIDQNVDLKFFFNSDSPEVPMFIKNYADHVEDLLKEYEVNADGRIRVQKYNPRPDSDAEEWAQNYGLEPQQFQMFGPNVYLGLVAVSGGRKEIISVLDPGQQDQLEYQITRLIYRVNRQEKPAVGVMSSLPVLGSDIPAHIAMQMQQDLPKKWLAFREIEMDYQIKKVETQTDSIPEDLAALIIVHPKKLPEETLLAIDQYLLSGGRLIIFVDPFSAVEMNTQSTSPNMMPGRDFSSNLEKLFAAWGLNFSNEKAVADPAAVIPSQMGTEQNDIVWLSIRDKWLSNDDIITSQLKMLEMPIAGAFKKIKNIDGLEIRNLAETSRHAGSVPLSTIQLGPAAVQNEFKAEDKSLLLALKITGTFQTAFPQDENKVRIEDDAPETHPEEAQISETDTLKTGKSSVVLVGDVDMLFDSVAVYNVPQIGYRLRNDNLNLFVNAVDLMAESPSLVNIRSRGDFQRPFEKVLEIQQRARSEWQEKEETLQLKLQETRRKLQNLRMPEQGQEIILSKEQQTAIEEYQKEEEKIREQLREVRKNLRKDIEQLGLIIKIINMAAMPLVVAICGIAFALYRRKKQ